MTDNNEIHSRHGRMSDKYIQVTGPEGQEVNCTNFTTRHHPADDEYIQLKVINEDSNEIHFRVKQTRHMFWLKKEYSEHLNRGVPVSSLRFLFDGRRINDHDSPKLLGMKQGDVIEVMTVQIGGRV